MIVYESDSLFNYRMRLNDMAYFFAENSLSCVTLRRFITMTTPSEMSYSILIVMKVFVIRYSSTDMKVTQRRAHYLLKIFL